MRFRAILVLLVLLVLSPPAVLMMTTGSTASEAVTLTGTDAVGAGAPLGRSITLADAAWIERAQNPDGALTEAPGSGGVSPYNANVAARGLARAAAAGDPIAGRAGWAWCHWYARHEGPSGYVPDYMLRGGALQSTGTMDSTDAYAGTFLSAVRDLYAATDNRGELAALHSAVSAAVGAIESTQDVDGLTWAKPSWRVKYLMDQAETYDGLVAASEVGVVVGDRVLSTRSAADAGRMWMGVQALWDNTSGSFAWAAGGPGARQPTDWSELYPDAMEQVWAVAYGLATPAEATLILRRVESTHGNWDVPLSLSRTGGRVALTGYWPVGAWADEQAGIDPTIAIASIRAGSLGRPWPFTTGAAGELLVAESPRLPTVAPPTVIPGPSSH